MRTLSSPFKSLFSFLLNSFLNLLVGTALYACYSDNFYLCKQSGADEEPEREYSPAGRALKEKL